MKLQETLLYTRNEAAKALGISVRTLDSWVCSGEIKPVRLGRLVRFQPTELQRVATEGVSLGGQK